MNIYNSFKQYLGKISLGFCLFLVGLAMSGATAVAQSGSFDPTSLVTTATGAVSAGLSVEQTVLDLVIAIVVGFVIFKVVKRALGKA